MTVPELIGCILTTFGPPFALFVFTVAQDPLKIILLIASSFFWLMSLLFTSLFHFIPWNSSGKYVLLVIIAILFQELFRYFFYLILKKARVGLEAVANRKQERKPLNMVPLYYVSGLGYGIISAAFASVNLYKGLSGPGSIGIKDDTQYFFIASAFTSLAFVLIHTCMGVVFMSGLDSHVKWRRIASPIIVILAHLLISGITILNLKTATRTAPLYSLTVTLPWIMVPVFAVLAWDYAGGRGRSANHYVIPPSMRALSAEI